MSITKILLSHDVFYDIIINYVFFLCQKNNEAEWRNNRHTLPPEWVERIEVVEEDITKIKSRSKDLTEISFLCLKSIF